MILLHYAKQHNFKEEYIMKGFLAIFQDSANEFGKVRTLTITGLFIGIYVIMESFFSLDINSFIKINFAFLALAIIGMLFGPCVSMPAAFLCDVIGFLMKPSGGFLVVFTLIAMVNGLIYGIFLYKKQGNKLIVSAIIAQTVIIICCNIGLNTLALIHYGYIPANIINKAMLIRIIKNAVELPIDYMCIVGILYLVREAYNSVFKRNRV